MPILPFSRDLIRLTMSYLQEPAGDFDTLFLPEGEAAFFAEELQDDQRAEAIAKTALKLIQNIKYYHFDSLLYVIQPFTTHLDQFRKILQHLEESEPALIATWLQARLDQYKYPPLSQSHLTISDFVNFLGFKDESEFRLILAVYSYFAQNKKNLVTITLTRESMVIYKYFIQHGVQVNNVPIKELLEWECYDVIDAALDANRIEDSHPDLSLLVEDAIKRNNLTRLSKLAFLDNLKIKDLIANFLSAALYAKDFNKAAAVAHYRHINHYCLYHAINEAMDGLNERLYQAVLNNPLIRERNELHFFTDWDKGQIPAHHLNSILTSQSPKANRILTLLLHAVTTWTPETQLIQVVLHSKINHATTNISAELWFRHLIYLINTDSKHPQIIQIFGISLWISKNILGLISPATFSFLLKYICEIDKKEKFKEILLHHRKSPSDTPNPLTKENSIHPDFSLEIFFGEDDPDKCFDKYPAMLADIKAFECLFYHCVGNEKLEEKLLKILHLQNSADKNKTILHYLVESTEENQFFIKLITKFIADKLYKIDFLYIKDTNHMTAVDYACLAGKPKKLSALFADHYSYNYNREEKLSPIDYVVVNNKPLSTMAECMQILYKRSNTAQDNYWHRYRSKIKDYFIREPLVVLDVYLRFLHKPEAQFYAFVHAHQLIKEEPDFVITVLSEINLIAALESKLLDVEKSDALSGLSEYYKRIQHFHPEKTWNSILQARYLIEYYLALYGKNYAYEGNKIYFNFVAHRPQVLVCLYDSNLSYEETRRIGFLLLKHFSFIKDELLSYCEMPNIKLVDADISILLEVHICYKKKNYNEFIKYLSTFVSSGRIDLQRIAIYLIAKWVEKGLFYVNNLIEFRRNPVFEPAMLFNNTQQSVIAKTILYFELNSTLTYCEGLKCLGELTTENVEVAENVLIRSPLKYNAIKNDDAKLEVLGHFAITIAYIERKKLSNGFLSCFNERTARNKIDPFIKNINEIMDSTENIKKKLLNLRETIFSIPSNHILRKAIDKYFENELFAALMDITPKVITQSHKKISN